MQGNEGRYNKLRPPVLVGHVYIISRADLHGDQRFVYVVKISFYSGLFLLFRIRGIRPLLIGKGLVQVKRQAWSSKQIKIGSEWSKPQAGFYCDVGQVGAEFCRAVTRRDNVLESTFTA